MWKALCLLAAATTAGFAAGTQGRLVTSPWSPAIPFGAAVKMTPDPSSIWSWHEEVRVTASPGGIVTLPVFIDIDGNGIMDTQDPWRRVLLANAQVVVRLEGALAPNEISLRDGSGALLDLTPTAYLPVNLPGTSRELGNAAIILNTPLALEPNSTLELFIAGNTADTYDLRVHLGGRVVNL